MGYFLTPYPINMAQLHNKYSREELLKRLEQEPGDRVTLSFYQYAKITDPALFRHNLYRDWESLGVLGRTYVAEEGINAQISVPRHNFEAFRDHLYEIPFLDGIRLNIAVEQFDKSFLKLTIKVRHKILADGLNDETFDVTNCGQHLNAAEFNELASQDNTVIIDMRNYYESEVGHFENAITPDVETFRDSLPIVEDILQEHKDKNILMYCTGGIRCEKASAWFKHKGFENVFQLNGGIIEYARQCRDQNLTNKFIGKNFVFDERLGERISGHIIAKCHQCGAVCDDHTNCGNVACNLLFIQCRNCRDKFDNCCSDECKSLLHLPGEQQRILRQGKHASKRYAKGKV